MHRRHHNQTRGWVLLSAITLLVCLGCADDGPGSKSGVRELDTSVVSPQIRDGGAFDMLAIPFLDTNRPQLPVDAGAPLDARSPSDTSADRCMNGAVRCGLSGEVERCGDFDGDGLPEWEVISLCPVGQQCLDGQCVADSSPGCDNACQPGESRCMGEFVQQCEQDPNQCWGWSRSMACPVDAQCVGGVCVPDNQCRHACREGDTRCAGEEVSQCVRDVDDCLVWSDIYPCPDDLSCRLGQCRCEDDCLVGSRECVAGGVRRCVLREGCGQWDRPMPCEAARECRNGFCVNAPCEHECIAPGQRQCVGDQIQGCELDANGCRVWGPSAPCEEERVCRENGCVFDCVNECEFAGMTRCVDMANIEQCRRDARTQCLAWTEFAMCPEASVCVENGQCRRQ